MRAIGRSCATVKIKSNITGTPVIINQTAYDADPDKYTLWVEGKDTVKEVVEKETSSDDAKPATSLKRRVKKRT